MNTKKPLILLTCAAALAGAGSTAAFAQSQAAIDGDADVFGKRIAFDAETPMSTNKVTFLYGGKKYKGRVTETDMEDRTKDWDAMGRSLKSDRRPGDVIRFRVRACDSSGCTTSRFQERVEWDD